jgi:hypothetical protein
MRRSAIELPGRLEAHRRRRAAERAQDAPGDRQARRGALGAIRIRRALSAISADRTSAPN